MLPCLQLFLLIYVEEGMVKQRKTLLLVGGHVLNKNE
jgi:hypothetical protein